MTEKIDYWYENREELAGLKKPILESAERYRIDNAINAMDKLYSDVFEYHYDQNGQLPQGEIIGPLLMKK
jgi:hypothetical protein